MNKWLIMKDNDILSQVVSQDPPGPDNGYDLEGKTVHQVSEFKPTDEYKYSRAAAGWVMDLAPAKTRSIALVNRLRERLQRRLVTEGVAKGYVYSQKSAEVDRSKAASAPKKPEEYPFAHAQLKRTGQTLAQVLAEFEQGRNTVLAVVAELEAIAQIGIININKATTVADIKNITNQTIAQLEDS
jgi:hypothetical protein